VVSTDASNGGYEEPPPGNGVADCLQLGFDGFVQCVARTGRELTRKDVVMTPVAEWLQGWLLEVFLAKTLQLGFWQLKKTAVKFKRKSKQAASGHRPGAQLSVLGSDVQSVLKEFTALRTALFSLLANYGVDQVGQRLLLRWLREARLDPLPPGRAALPPAVHAQVAAVAARLGQRAKLSPEEKAFVKGYALDSAAENEISAVLHTLDTHQHMLTEVFLYYGSGFLLDLRADMPAGSGQMVRGPRCQSASSPLSCPLPTICRACIAHASVHGDTAAVRRMPTAGWPCCWSAGWWGGRFRRGQRSATRQIWLPTRHCSCTAPLAGAPVQGLLEVAAKMRAQQRVADGPGRHRRRRGRQPWPRGQLQCGCTQSACWTV
jgi:hypothetical protein